MSNNLKNCWLESKKYFYLVYSTEKIKICFDMNYCICGRSYFGHSMSEASRLAGALNMAVKSTGYGFEGWWVRVSRK